MRLRASLLPGGTAAAFQGIWMGGLFKKKEKRKENVSTAAMLTRLFRGNYYRSTVFGFPSFDRASLEADE